MYKTRRNVFFVLSLITLIILTVSLFSCGDKKEKNEVKEEIISNNCTVTFDYGYKNSPEAKEVKVTCGRTISSNDMPVVNRVRGNDEKFEYKYLGWYYSNGKKYNNMEDIIDKDVTLTAKWEIKKMYFGSYPKTLVDESEVYGIDFFNESFSSDYKIGTNGVDKYLKTKDNKYYKFEQVSWSYIPTNNILEEGKRVGYFIADDILDASKFAEKDLIVKVGAEQGIYEKSTIRKYINYDFLKRMFSEDEAESIILTEVKHDNNTVKYDKILNTRPTKDKIFLPSEKGITEKCLKCNVTDFAKMKMHTNVTYYSYYLRSPELYGLDLLDPISKIKLRQSNCVYKIATFDSVLGIRPVLACYID